MDIQKALSIAIAYHNSGQLKEAERIYRDILKVVNTHPIALTLLAKLSFTNGKYNEVKKILPIVLKHYPEYMKAHVLAGDYYSQANEYEIAGKAYRRAILLYPSQAATLISLGNLIQSNSLQDDKLLSILRCLYRKASIIEPASIPALNNLAAIHLKLKEPYEALKTLNFIFEVDPHNIRSLAYKTVALMGADEESKVDYLVGFGDLVKSRLLEIDEKLGGISRFNSKLREVLKRHPNRTSEWDPTQRAIRGGAIVPRLFEYQDPILDILKLSLEKTINQYISELPSDQNHPFLAIKPDKYSIDIWANFLGPTNYQSGHIHNKGWLSGVFYVNTYEGNGRESDPTAGWIEFNRPGYGLPCFGGEKFIRKIKPEPGLVVMFPSYVWHGTIPFSDEGERISIAFDVHI